MIQGGWNPGTRRVLTNNPYVTDGLVAMWDGIWNVGNGSKKHDPSLHVWRDQVGGGIPIVAPSNGVYFTENGLYSDSLANTQTPCGPICGGPIGTDDEYAWIFHELVFEIPDFRGQNAPLIMACGKRAMAWMNVPSNGIGITSSRSNTWTFPGVDFTVLPLKLHVSVSYAGTSLTDLDGQRIWVNGLENGTHNGNADSWANIKMNTCMIGNVYNGTIGYTVPITYHSIRLYNRVLTQDEITANHVVDMERFGIGGGG